MRFLWAFLDIFRILKILWPFFTIFNDTFKKNNFIMIFPIFGFFLNGFSQNIGIQIFFWCFFWNHNKKLMLYSKNWSWPMFLADFPKSGRSVTDRQTQRVLSHHTKYNLSHKWYFEQYIAKPRNIFI